MEEPTFDPADPVWSLKALSIMQPWSWLIVSGAKDIENRDWPTRFRGPVLIHAGKKFDGDKREDLGRPFMGVTLPEHLDMGGIVGVAEIVDCIEFGDPRSYSPWFFGKFGFVLRNARPLPFRPCRGALSFFRPDYSCPPVLPRPKAPKPPKDPRIVAPDPQPDMFERTA